ncbi:MAG: stage IV sporulation protein A [Clostridia bacterium]|nr:stage IV sporulation protein A [Clostridia bacterium]
MEKYDVYKDIAKRTDGDIYVGAVGPVRTGKSTFIRRFTEIFVLPNISAKNKKKIATDELPVSGEGKTITTTEPKFIPGEGINVTFKDKTTARVRLIDCVGYIVDGSIGYEEDGSPRMVKTPWSQDPMPFNDAAEIGTEKVISEHSTIGIVVTTDGTITDIPRENYVAAEERTIEKLQAIGKPFAVVINSASPESDDCKALARRIEDKYGVKPIRMNVLSDGEDKFAAVFEAALTEFPLKTVDVEFPDWLKTMPPDSKTVGQIIEAVKLAAVKAVKMKDLEVFEEAVATVDKIIPEKTEVIAGEGKVKVLLSADKSLFYDVIGEAVGETVDGEYKLMSVVSELAEKKREYDKIEEGIKEAEKKGYGIVVPDYADAVVSEPEIVRKGTGYGVKITAETESVHVIKIGVKTTISPLSGTKRQCEEFVKYVREQAEGVGLTNVNVFGRPLGQIVADEINLRAGTMPDETRNKMTRSLSKMVNEGKYRVFYIVY